MYFGQGDSDRRDLHRLRYSDVRRVQLGSMDWKGKGRTASFSLGAVGLYRVRECDNLPTHEQKRYDDNARVGKRDHDDRHACNDHLPSEGEIKTASSMEKSFGSSLYRLWHRVLRLSQRARGEFHSTGGYIDQHDPVLRRSVEETLVSTVVAMGNVDRDLYGICRLRVLAVERGLDAPRLSAELRDLSRSRVHPDAATAEG